MTTASLTAFPVAIAVHDMLTTRGVRWARRWGRRSTLMIAGLFALPALPPWQAFTAWVMAS